ncbi:hypothetical protein ML462_13015 [Gramella lutea]|uniref:Lipoprotein n=1 Tax=Christiangramia lutea TaxID=1607951 RepID=A0A9X1V488_9FLAO|nr:hypothetical protein [Christiangramia lutea]MCH4824092.1 hypothetical protein [Christiangramia lutea]
MRVTTFLLLLILCFYSCKENKNDGDPDQENYQEVVQDSKDNSPSSDDDIKKSDYIEDQTKNDTGPSENVTSETSRITPGLYLNSGEQQDLPCNCNCVDINFSSTSELCLKKDELYINARFEENGNNVNVYFVNLASSSSNEEIPWDNFETGTPIAVLSHEGNNRLKLDWKGFSEDGKIAVDYALLGKKTLEGTYKKK